ncbi:MAG: hypothetical protein WBV11_08605 [Salegentibacter sp.]
MIKQRLLTGWNFPRIIYLVIGLLITMQAVSEDQWWGVALGAYMILAGIFAFGCAGGACALPKQEK